MRVLKVNKENTKNILSDLLCSVLNADVYRTNEDIANNIKTKIIDDHLRKWIDLQYDIK